MKIVGWAGVVLVLLATVPAFNISYVWVTDRFRAGRISEGVIMTLLVGVLGSVLALTGAFASRSRTVSWGVF